MHTFLYVDNATIKRTFKVPCCHLDLCCIIHDIDAIKVLVNFPKEVINRLCFPLANKRCRLWGFSPWGGYNSGAESPTHGPITYALIRLYLLLLLLAAKSTCVCKTASPSMSMLRRPWLLDVGCHLGHWMHSWDHHGFPHSPTPTHQDVNVHHKVVPSIPPTEISTSTTLAFRFVWCLLSCYSSLLLIDGPPIAYSSQSLSYCSCQSFCHPLQTCSALIPIVTKLLHQAHVWHLLLTQTWLRQTLENFEKERLKKRF